MTTKKILLIFILSNFLVFLLIPVGVLAQKGPLECCKLRKQIEFEGVTYNRGIWVGEMGCSIDGTISVKCRTSSGTQSRSCATLKWGILCVLNTIYTITDWIFFILVAFTTLMIIGGAFIIATAGGDPSKVSTGRNYIMYAMLGLIVALLSRSFPSIVKALLG